MLFDSSPITLPDLADEPESLSEQELLLMRSRIDALLPVQHLTDLNMENELILQLRAAQELQRAVINDDDVMPNQKAQVLNSVASVLAAVGKMQNEYYTSERLKRIERLLIEMLSEWPDDMTEKFLSQYTTILK